MRIYVYVCSYYLIQQLPFFVCNTILGFENSNDVMGLINVHRYVTDGACRTVGLTVPCQPDRLLAYQVVCVWSGQTAWHVR
jgi:hypothetical protein